MNRIAIPPSNGLTTVTGSNLNASKEVGEPIHAGVLDGRSVWWSWTAPISGPIRMSTVGSGFDTLLAVYTGDSVTTLTTVAANDDAGCGRYSSVRFASTAGIQYQIAVDGYAARQGSIVLGVFPLVSAVSLAAALDDPGLTWLSGGEPWLGQAEIAHDGVDAARSGPIDAYSQSWIETTVIGPGPLTFQWKVSSQANYDYLRFYINGVEQDRTSGEVDWRQRRDWLGVDANTLRWKYSKGYNFSAGQDAGWVDEVSFVQYTRAIPANLGDLDRDGQPTVLDLTMLIGYLRDTNNLLPQIAAFADLNSDHVVNTNDVTALADAILGRIGLLAAADTDGDGIPDVLEPLMGLNPATTDSFGDGISDADRDFDNDGVSNGQELRLGTDPMRLDTDGDGWRDEAELTAGSNPLDASSRPYIMVVSTPPTALYLPANEGTGGLSNNTVIAMPPVSLMLPADEGAGGVSNNTVIAMPPVSLMLPANEGAGGLSNNTVIGMPPVQMQIGTP